MPKPTPGEQRPIATNRKAYHDYAIEDTMEAGVALRGSEVKVLRAGKCVLIGAHVRVVGGNAVLFGLSIPEYPWSHQFNHVPERERRLLLHKHQIEKLHAELRQKGTSCVVLRVYWVGDKVKVEIGLGAGKKQHDKRATLKDKDAKREIARAIR